MLQAVGAQHELLQRRELPQAGGVREPLVHEAEPRQGPGAGPQPRRLGQAVPDEGQGEQVAQRGGRHTPPRRPQPRENELHILDGVQVPLAAGLPAGVPAWFPHKRWGAAIVSGQRVGREGGGQSGPRSTAGSRKGRGRGGGGGA